MAHRNPELVGGGLDRARGGLAAPAPAAVGPRDTQHHVVAGVHKGAQRRHCELRCPEVRQAGHVSSP